VEHTYDVGMIGLGVMGKNYALNITEHGYSVIGYDRDQGKVAAVRRLRNDRVSAVGSPAEVIKALKTPRMVILLVPAGPPVDAVLRDLVPLLAPVDIIIDAGNSHFSDTDIRQRAMAKRKLILLGVGVSGGEAGARHGPSIMPGGDHTAYTHIQPIFEATAANVDGEPCVTYLGSGSAGHYVKMVHNGIEYALMQLIAETYDLMKRGMGKNDDELHEIYAQWNGGPLNSYLIEITADIFTKVDTNTGRRLIDVILDAAKQTGTGKWTSQDAMALNVPVSLVDIAVGMRDLSACEDLRHQTAKVLVGPDHRFEAGQHASVTQLHNALYMGLILAYTQGFDLLRAASQAYKYNFTLEDIARIWRGGCIIRSTFLHRIRDAYRRQPDLPRLFLDAEIAKELSVLEHDLRRVVMTAVDLGIPIPGLMVALGYYDAYRSHWLPANLIQAQRDYFGAHHYERTDEHGEFHTAWAA